MASKTPTSFIPYQNHHIIEGYAVTSSFTDANVNLDKIGSKYKNYLNSLIAGESAVNQQALLQAISTLQSVVAMERSAELAFLAELGAFGINMDNTEAAWKDLIESFNLIFSTESVLERNISRLKQLNAKNNKGQYDDITRFLQNTYLPKAISEFMPIKSVSEINEQLLLKIMRRAVELMFKMTDAHNENKEQLQAYKEIWDALKKLTYRNTLFKNLLSLFNLEEYLTTNLNTLNNNSKYTTYPEITAKQKNVAGDIYEAVENAVIGQFAKMGKFHTSSGIFDLTTQVIATGPTQQKADNTLIMAEGSINTKSLISGAQRKDNSVRLRSLERIEQLLETIGKKKAQIVFISDKNYALGGSTYHNFKGGFKAEEPTLSSLATYGSKFNIPNVTGMIDYLASAGEGMLVNDVESCMQIIETCIGNFLFDDLHIQVPTSSGANRVHLLSLSGTYIPASVYLEATLQGLQGLGNLSVDELVDARFNPSLNEPTSSSQEAWDAFVASRKKETIHISFMAGYTKFMSTLFK